jgi:type VI secretion system protein ImpE
MNAREYYQAGQLKEAIAAISAEVKQHPTDTARRGFLCELVCFSGDLDRADMQLEIMATQDPEAALGLSLFRQLVRAEQARRQFYAEGRLPEFLGEPGPGLRLRLEASILIREGQMAEATKRLDEAEGQRPRVSGVCNDQPFGDLRDLDDLTAGVFEVLTSNGKYYWIPIEQVELVEFRPPGRPRDLLWQRAHMIVRGGPDGEVFLPTLYAGTHAEPDDRMRLGRATDWRGGNGGPVRGVGLRTFLVGEESLTTLEMKNISVDFGKG